MEYSNTIEIHYNEFTVTAINGNSMCPLPDESDVLFYKARLIENGYTHWCTEPRDNSKVEIWRKTSGVSK